MGHYLFEREQVLFNHNRPFLQVARSSSNSRHLSADHRQGIRLYVGQSIRRTSARDHGPRPAIRLSSFQGAHAAAGSAAHDDHRVPSAGQRDDRALSSNTQGGTDGKKPLNLVRGASSGSVGSSINNETRHWCHTSRAALWGNSETAGKKLSLAMQQLRPTAVINHTEQVPYVPPSLAHTTHVFIRNDTVKPAMKQPYDGPFLVIDRKAKFFIVRRRGRDDKVSIDRLKPAFISDQDADTTTRITNTARTTSSGYRVIPIPLLWRYHIEASGGDNNTNPPCRSRRHSLLDIDNRAQTIEYRIRFPYS